MTGEEEAADRLLPLGAEPQPAHPRIVNAPGPADQAQALESLGLAGHRRGVDAQPFGQIGNAQAALFRVQRVEDRQPGLVDVETSLLEDEIVQPGLLEPSGQQVQRRLDVRDRLVVHRNLLPGRPAQAGHVA